jgi:hypothetical protein
MGQSERSARQNTQHWRMVTGAALAASSIVVPLRLTLHVCALHPRGT